jgi:dienelactone hydrolase
MAMAGLPSSVGAAPAASTLRAENRQGQVFLTWEESRRETDVRYIVRASAQPITAANVSQATILAQSPPGSANDWWLNPETYGAPLEVDPKTGKKPDVPRRGFVLRSGADALDPGSGLFVHTVTADDPAECYYAVTFTSSGGTPQDEVVPGANCLSKPVAQRVADAQPLWQGKAEQAPPPGAGQGRPLHLVLHAKRGRGGMDWLAFGDSSLGWREGLPLKFGVKVTDDAVVVSPTDRTWIDRMFPEGKDECERLTPAIHSFWYGYNSHINGPARMDTGVATDYTERRLLWILRWVQRYYGTDPNRTYCYGSSMGGCGSISFALRHPEVFAAIRAHVPIVEYDKGKGGDSEVRVIAECGPLDRPCSEGMLLRQRLSGTQFAKSSNADLPFLVITNGRKDGSIPWWKNPDFYRALNDRRQAFLAAWDNGEHGTCGQGLPDDVKRWNDLKRLHRFALNKSYLAFSNCSANDDPGKGDATDGDLVGFMNRWLSYADPIDESGRYEVLIRWEGPADKLPVTVDVTPRRRQQFRPQPGVACAAENVDADTAQQVQRLEATVEATGLFAVTGFRLTSQKGNRLTVTAGE